VVGGFNIVTVGGTIHLCEKTAKCEYHIAKRLTKPC
jgi:hypothetical protein